MTATEELRARLDELGVKPTYARTITYKGYAHPVNHYTRWKSSYGATCLYHENEQQGSEPLTCLKIEGHDVTPEQAIAATVGAGTCDGSFHKSSDISSGRVPLYYCKGTNRSIFVEREAKVCPLCGGRIKEEDK